MTQPKNKRKPMQFDYTTRWQAILPILGLTTWFWGMLTIPCLILLFIGGVKLFLGASALIFVIFFMIVSFSALDQRVTRRHLQRRFTIDEFEALFGKLHPDTSAMLQPDDEIYRFKTNSLRGYVVVRNGKVTRMRYIKWAGMG